MASAWVQQYARHVATRHRGPVGLVRLRSGEAQLDVVGGANESSRSCATMDEAVRVAAQEVVAWVVRVDQTAEPRLPELSGLTSVTLLTGADEAAVVGAYSTLKNLARPGDDVPGPELQVTIMGATPDKAAEAAAKLERATAVFMGKPIRVGACIARIGGRASVPIFRGSWSGGLDEWLAMAAGLPPVTVAKPISPVQEPPPQAHEPVVSRLGRLHQSATCAPAVAPGPLAGHIAGLKSIDVTCPYATGIEFAVDDRGCMHVLGHMGTGDLSGLLTAAAWVRSHQGLLRMALRPVVQGFKGGEASILHLFTDDARTVRALGDSPVRLHLLARVDSTGGEAWFCTPLN
jgi:hypothetical protein